MAKKKFVPIKQPNVKLASWERVMDKSIIPMGNKSRAAVVVDSKNVPLLFIFDTFAFLDILSKIDEELADRLSSKDYHSKSINPAGWFIDEIETRLPLNKSYVKSLKQAINEAKEKGWIPFEKIEQDVLH